ncbi:MAG: respiratory nitrate reductase subunit gamma, partial [Alphaproteobacteria bacterium]|nr:respiratory nitrate reductase subunit gamma [Alphaproteobacteria bacterium]
MQDIIYSIIFGIYPYVAIAVFVVATFMRFRDNEYSVTAKSSQLLNAPGDRTMFIIAMMS